MTHTITLDEVVRNLRMNNELDDLLRQPTMDNFLAPLELSITMVNRHLNNLQYEISSYGSVMISHVASGILVRVNEQIKSSARNKKRKLKSILGELFKGLLNMVAKLLPKDRRYLFWNMIRTALLETCELFNYRTQELQERLALRHFCFKKACQLVPMFVWKGDEADFQKLLKLVQDLKIGEIKEFKRLFERSEDYQHVSLNTDEPNYVLQFLACLKESGLIGVSGARGFYKVLAVRVPGFRSVFLKNRDARRRVNTVKNLVTWPGRQKLFNTMLKSLL